MKKENSWLIYWLKKFYLLFRLFKKKKKKKKGKKKKYLFKNILNLIKENLDELVAYLL